MFIPYKDIDGDSNIKSYEIGPDFINIIFYGTNAIYIYNYLKPGRYHVENMKTLAYNGDGLNSYINRNVKFAYYTKKNL